jgi:tetratricopeptide (TPR) repeat protein
MGQIESVMIVDDNLMPVKIMAATLKGKASGKPVGNSRFGEKTEGALEKLHSLFRYEKWKDQRDFKYYLGLVRKEPENTFARLRLAEIYLKRGEKRKAIIVYLQTAEIFSRKRLYSQAVAIYKRIQKQDPAVMHLYPKLAEICRKMGFQEEASSQSSRGMEESGTKSMGRDVTSKPRNILEEIQEKKVQSFPGGTKAQAEKDGKGNPGKTGELTFPEQEQEEGLFDLSAQLEFIEPPEGKEVFEVTAEKSYGLEEIFRELKKIDFPGEAYPNFNYNMGLACRELGLIEEAIEQFHIAFESGQRPFEAAHLLGLCFLDKEQLVEARQSFEKALKVDGISKDKTMEIELALKDMEPKREEACREFARVNRGESQKTKGSSRPQNKKVQLVTLGTSLISPRQA